jgi:hypothetical protein
MTLYENLGLYVIVLKPDLPRTILMKLRSASFDENLGLYVIVLNEAQA